MNFQVVFNLYPIAHGLYLPNAHIVQMDQSGQPAHIMRRAMTDTIAAYEIPATAILLRLFQTIDDLSPKHLEAKFKPPKAKVPTALTQLLADKDTKAIVQGYIYRELDIFLSEIVRNRFYLALEAEKRTLVKDVLIGMAKEDLVPYLHFKKTPAGVEYRLQLGNDDEKWIIRERDVVPLTNTAPAWVLVTGHYGRRDGAGSNEPLSVLHRLVGINGNMVKPFQKADMLDIQEKNVRAYFQKVVVKNANRTNIEPEGFDLLLQNRLLACQLTLTEDIFERSWLLVPLFRYEGYDFEPWELRSAGFGHATNVSSAPRAAA